MKWYKMHRMYMYIHVLCIITKYQKMGSSANPSFHQMQNNTAYRKIFAPVLLLPLLPLSPGKFKTTFK